MLQDQRMLKLSKEASMVHCLNVKDLLQRTNLVSRDTSIETMRYAEKETYCTEAKATFAVVIMICKRKRVSKQYPSQPVPHCASCPSEIEQRYGFYKINAMIITYKK
ncbi:hypothetical protein EAF00_002683 [Botryotinia globosa]|nr:hypothetical protein EAF00_002683 [Botryotinia globosa]